MNLEVIADVEIPVLTESLQGDQDSPRIQWMASTGPSMPTSSPAQTDIGNSKTSAKTEKRPEQLCSDRTLGAPL